MSVVSLASGLRLCEPSKQNYNAALRKQSLMVQRRRALKGASEQFYSIEELLNRIPFQCMVNPYITRLVNFDPITFFSLKPLNIQHNDTEHNKKCDAMTLSIMAFGIMTLSIKGLFVTFSITTHSITTLRHYAECRIFIGMLNVAIYVSLCWVS